MLVFKVLGLSSTVQGVVAALGFRVWGLSLSSRVEGLGLNVRV